MKKRYFWILVTIVSLCFSCSTVAAQQARVLIISPRAGQQFAPGDQVNIEVEFPATLHATDGSVGTKGLGSLEAKDFTGTHFKTILNIPQDYAGPLELFPSVMAGDFVMGEALVINVRPQDVPKELSFIQRNYFLSPSEKQTQLYVKGKYANGERDLTSSVSGTTYVSSDTNVITVNSEGLCTIVGKGFAVITVENKGVRSFEMIVVEDPQHPNPPIDLTNKVSFKRGPQREEENGHRILQTVTITNTSDLPIVVPLFLLVTDLPDGARSYANAWSVRTPDGLNLFPGQSTDVEMTFLLWKNVTVDYQLKLYSNDPLSQQKDSE